MMMILITQMNAAFLLRLQFAEIVCWWTSSWITGSLRKNMPRPFQIFSRHITVELNQSMSLAGLRMRETLLLLRSLSLDQHIAPIQTDHHHLRVLERPARLFLLLSFSPPALGRLVETELKSSDDLFSAVYSKWPQIGSADDTKEQCHHDKLNWRFACANCAVNQLSRTL